ncbi:hypothetical protein [Streptomyces sp. NPDC003247]|uniref:hypothetical protein n=1 Tax=Streptomyces sp. NPDC003247 TaxID=3364677 RepID=UPI0036A24663
MEYTGRALPLAGFFGSMTPTDRSTAAFSPPVKAGSASGTVPQREHPATARNADRKFNVELQGKRWEKRP